jgi:ribose 5-phosphate isomerase B
MANRPTRRTRVLSETIIIGCDHRGYAMKEFVKEELARRKFAVKDVGAFTADQPSDYPVHVSKVAGAVSAGVFRRGIAIDGSGVGASAVANRFPYVRAALCNDIGVAKLAREHTDANVLVMAGMLTPNWLAAQILEAWLTTPFEGGRHLRRVKLIDDNTQLSIALSHLDEIDPAKIDATAISEPFVRRALKGLERIAKLFRPDERRAGETARMAESCPTKITCGIRKYSALMLDLSAHGAQFRLQGPEAGQVMLDDAVECAVRTPYGLSTCRGTVKWVDARSRTIGVAFEALPRAPKDPLRLLQDSWL